jgi:hypothetical protein
MTTFSLNPTYYQVTWSLTSPTDYSGLTGDGSGGLDPITPFETNRIVSITGNQSITTTVMSDSETINVNGQIITFMSTDTLADIVDKINTVKKFSGVVASQQVAGTYLTLSNAPKREGYPFYLAEGNGTALAKLGLAAATYRHYPSEIGGAFTSVTNGMNVTINGTTLVFTAGGLSSVASQLNSSSAQTGVIAYEAGPYLQLASENGQPWVINSGNAVANLGFPVGTYGGYPDTVTSSLSKERGNMRWQQVINELEYSASPILIGNMVMTGNVDVTPETVTFTVGYDRPAQVTTVARSDEPDAGTVLVGVDAVKRAVARALTVSMAGNRKVFDPTIDQYGAYADRPNPIRIQRVTASAIDTVANIAIVEDNLSVSQVAAV